MNALATLLPKAMKPEEITGPPEVREAIAQRSVPKGETPKGVSRAAELVRWFARHAEGHANPKWFVEHAYELAAYVAGQKSL